MGIASVAIEATRSFNAVAAGQTATLDLPTTDIYHGLKLLYGTSTVGGATQANMEAELDELRLIVNGVVQRRFTGRQLFDLNAYHGKSFSTGIAPIYFAEPWRKTAQGADGLAWGMADVDTFTVEVDINAGATAPTLSAIALKRPGNAPMGPIVKWRQFVIPVGATGITNLSTLPKQDAYYALHCDSTNIDDVHVKVDQRTEIDATVAMLHDWIDDHGYVPQADWTHIDFAATRRVSDILPMRAGGAAGGPVRDFQIDFNMSAATAFTLLAETLGPRDA